MSTGLYPLTRIARAIRPLPASDRKRGEVKEASRAPQSALRRVVRLLAIEHALQGVYILPKQAEGLLSAFSKPDVLEL